LEKKINQITFYFVEECPGRGSEDIKKECDVSCFDYFLFSVLFMDVMSGKITMNLHRTALQNNKKKHIHTGKELEAHEIEKGRLSCDSDAPQVGSDRSVSTRVVKVNRPKVNRRKMRPYCVYVCVCVYIYIYMCVCVYWKVYGSNSKTSLSLVLPEA
jgi:hypothetical protein